MRGLDCAALVSRRFGRSAAQVRYRERCAAQGPERDAPEDEITRGREPEQCVAVRQRGKRPDVRVHDAIQKDVAVSAYQRSRHRSGQWHSRLDPKDALRAGSEEPVPQSRHPFQQRPARDYRDHGDCGRAQIRVEEPVYGPIALSRWNAGSLSMTACVMPNIRKLKCLGRRPSPPRRPHVKRRDRHWSSSVPEPLERPPTGAWRPGGTPSPGGRSPRRPNADRDTPRRDGGGSAPACPRCTAGRSRLSSPLSGFPRFAVRP